MGDLNIAIDQILVALASLHRPFTNVIRSATRAQYAVILLIAAGVSFSDPSVVSARSKERCKQNVGNLRAHEKWAWEEICRGRWADFNRRKGNEKLDPRNPAHDDQWATGSRTLRPSFFKKILSDKSLLSAIQDKGIRIRGAYFKPPIRLKGQSDGPPLSMDIPLSIDKSFFDSAVVMRRIMSRRGVSFTRSRFEKNFTMDSVKIGSDLVIRDNRFKNGFRLEGTEIGGELDISKSVFRIARRTVKLRDLSIASNLDMRGITLRSMDLTNTQINGQLLLNKSIAWKAYTHNGKESHPSKLILLNSSVGTLRDADGAWPDELELDGFTYKHFGKVGRSLLHQRNSDWFVGWLAKDQTYTPQPYWHLAELLSDAGRGWMAYDVLYANLERWRKEPEMPWPTWLLLSALNFVFGYGYGWRSFLTLLWGMLFVIIGTTILRNFKECDMHGGRLGFWYSLDMLLPAIHLREQHYKVDLKTKAKYYFYIHKIIGYTLAFFLLAGLSGFTKQF